MQIRERARGIRRRRNRADGRDWRRSWGWRWVRRDSSIALRLRRAERLNNCYSQDQQKDETKYPNTSVLGPGPFVCKSSQVEFSYHQYVQPARAAGDLLVAHSASCG